jgi:hypothetical protein
MPYETNQRAFALVQRATARLAGVSGLQRPQSFVREFPASPDHCIAFSEHDYVRASAKGLSAHCEW